MTLSHGSGLRIIIILLAVLISLQILIVGFAYFVRAAQLGHPARPQLVEQVAAAVTLINRTPPDLREETLLAVNSPFLSFSLGPEALVARGGAMARPLPVLMPIISVYREALGGRDFQIYSRQRRSFTEGGSGLLPDEIVFVIRLEDGAVLIVEPNKQYRHQLAVNALALVSSIVGVVLLTALVWAAFATTRPINDIATAAEQLVGDLSAPPIVERGPKPVRHLARSFNKMQADLLRLMSERTVTLAAIAHDYRTYLTRLRLRVESIVDEKQRGKAIADLDEMSALIDDTLLLARVGSSRARIQVMNAAQLAADCVERALEAGARVTFTAGPGATDVYASAMSIRRAIDNLIDNAVKYGGAAHVRVASEDGDVVISVSDEGPGIAKDDLESLTQPFVRLEQSRSRATGGAGLGLAIAKSLVEASGGRLSLSSAPGEGLRAEISLPAVDKTAG
jgi:signal transduction histidine kinase